MSLPFYQQTTKIIGAGNWLGVDWPISPRAIIGIRNEPSVVLRTPAIAVSVPVENVSPLYSVYVPPDGTVTLFRMTTLAIFQLVATNSVANCVVLASVMALLGLDEA